MQTPETSAPPQIEATPEASPSPKIEITPAPTPQGEAKPEVKNEEPTPVKAEPSPTPIVETTSETKPTPVATPETTPQVSPSPEIKSEIPETKTIESREKLKNPEPSVSPTPKPLFEPIIIIVPKPETKIESTDLKPADTAIQEEQNPENKSSEKSETPKPLSPIASSGEVRPRLSPVNSTAENSKSENDSCQLSISQDSVSILSQGGSLGVLLGFQGDGGDVSKITATSDSPGDLEILLEPDIGKQSKRAFFIIKSISDKKGTYTVTFDSPCGKKEVLVKVR
jgi:hypothetical protein